MKYNHSILGLLLLFAASCSFNEIALPEENIDSSADAVFYATVEEQPDADTKVYADEDLKVLWNADDRITIFSKNTYNQQYRFLGVDGDNAGAFKKVQTDDYITGNELDKTYAVYPYKETTKISNKGIITTSISAEQVFKEGSFGIGANTMVSATDDNMLKFKNVGGYLSLKFYGEGVSVSSITLKSNNGELIAGDCTIDMSSGVPVSSIVTEKATDEVTLTCDPPLELPAEKDDAVMVIFVLYPGTLTGGFTVTINTPDGGVFEKSSVNERIIKRSSLTRLGAIEVVPEYAQPNNVIYYTSSDGEVVTPRKTDVFGANIIDNKYENGRGILTFDGEVTYIGDCAFESCLTLTSILIPGSVTSIGDYAFDDCVELSSIALPNSIMRIGDFAFASSGIAYVILPSSVTHVGSGAFAACNNMTSITVDSANPIYDSRNNCGAIIETESNALIAGFKGSVIPDTVTSIGDNAFYGSKLIKIRIPSSVTTIGDKAFFWCLYLKYVYIPESVTSIGSSAFQYCKLKSIVIPNSVVSIGEAAFAACSLISINIPGSVKSIGNEAFSSCSSLTSITFDALAPPSGGKDMFYDTNNCPIYVSAESVEAYKTAQYWSDYAGRIQTIPMSNNTIYYTSTNGGIVTPYSSSAFGANIVSNEYIDGQGRIVFDGDVVSIGESAFKDCINLATISIPQSVTSIGDNAFNYCRDLSLINIPETVYSIGKDAFSTCFNLPSIVIPQSVERIEEKAFYTCLSLASVILPDNLTSIGDYAFSGCSHLVALDIPESVMIIGDYAFHASGLCSVVIPESVTNIGDGAFRGCSLSSLSIPESEICSICIERNVFAECSNLERINGKRELIIDGLLIMFAPAGISSYSIPTSVVRIGNSAFAYCRKLSSVFIPESVLSIGDYAFAESGLTSVVIPKTVSSIGVSIFRSNYSLTSILVDSDNPSYDSRDNCNAIIDTRNNTLIAGCKNTVIPNSVTSIGYLAFVGCDFISINIPESVKSIGDNAFYLCINLTSVSIPKSVTRIGDMAFSHCHALTIITIPESVTSIDGYAFENCRSLTTITIPESVTRIDYYAFSHCSSLECIIVNAFAPPLGGRNMFEYTNDCPIYVPAESVEAYKTAQYWSDYADRIQAIPE